MLAAIQYALCCLLPENNNENKELTYMNKKVKKNLKHSNKEKMS